MSKNIKILSVFLIIAMLLSCLFVPAMASEEGNATVEKAYDWEYDLDNDVLKNSDREYQKYTLPIGYSMYSKDSVYVYKNNYVNNFANLHSYERNGEIVWENSTTVVYATNTGKGYIEDLIAGNYSSFSLHKNYSSFDISSSDVQALDEALTSGEKVSLDVTELSRSGEYQIRAYDYSGCIYYVYGAIHEYSGEYYYINYDVLPNNYFDSDGDFSFRRGEVSAVKLSGTLLDGFNEAVEEMISGRLLIYESEEVKGSSLLSSKAMAYIRFFLIFSIVGYALPIFVGIISFRRARKTVPEHMKYWYIVSGASALCIVCSVVVTLLTLLGL